MSHLTCASRWPRLTHPPRCVQAGARLASLIVTDESPGGAIPLEKPRLHDSVVVGFTDGSVVAYARDDLLKACNC